MISFLIEKDELSMSNYLEKLNAHSEHVNTSELLNRLCGNVILVNKFIGVFYKTFKDIVAEIEDSIEEGNLNEAAALVHKIKGSSGNLNLTRIYDKSCKLEQAIKSEQEADIHNEFKAFKEVLDEFFKIIE